jgi:hypothetical protein
MLIREIIAVYFQRHSKYINPLYEPNALLLDVKVGGAYSYHYDLKK